jgi:transposase InsO family protein
MKAITDTLGIARSNQYETKKTRVHYQKPDDEKYLSLIRKLVDQRPSWGYRTITAILNRQLTDQGQSRVNHKRVYRLMKMHHLLLQKHTGRPIRLHEGTIITLTSNMRWCSDGFEIACWNGERVRVIFAMDCADREILSYVATTGGISGQMVRDLTGTGNREQV